MSEWNKWPEGITPNEVQQLVEEHYEERLKAIKEHVKKFPNEKDGKYSVKRHYPSTAGDFYFNSVQYLTDLETWYKGLLQSIKETSPKVKSEC